MSQARTDNSELWTKVHLREKRTQNGSVVLDCYHGNGILWDIVMKTKKIEVVGVEKEHGKATG